MNKSDHLNDIQNCLSGERCTLGIPRTEVAAWKEKLLTTSDTPICIVSEWIIFRAVYYPIRVTTFVVYVVDKKVKTTYYLIFRACKYGQYGPYLQQISGISAQW